jgi:hypothetical protein
MDKGTCIAECDIGFQRRLQRSHFKPKRGCDADRTHKQLDHLLVASRRRNVHCAETCARSQIDVCMMIRGLEFRVGGLESGTCMVL